MSITVTSLEFARSVLDSSPLEETGLYRRLVRIQITSYTISLYVVVTGSEFVLLHDYSLTLKTSSAMSTHMLITCIKFHSNLFTK